MAGSSPGLRSGACRALRSSKSGEGLCGSIFHTIIVGYFKRIARSVRDEAGHLFLQDVLMGIGSVFVRVLHGVHVCMVF